MRIGLKQQLFNAEVRRRRTAMGLSQKQLGLKIGVSSVTISHVEILRNTNPKSDVIQKLAAFFSCTTDDLCPPWLQMIDEVPKSVTQEREVTAASLENMKARIYALPAPDEEVVFDEEWLMANAKELLTPRQYEVFKLTIGDRVQSPLNGYDIAARMNLTYARIRQLIFTIKDKLGKAWRQHLELEENS